MSNNGGFGIAAYGAPPAFGTWPNDGMPPTYTPPFDVDPAKIAETMERINQTARFPVSPKPMQETAAAIVREQIERLVRLRLSPAVTDEATRAELDAIIGALTVAVSVP